MKGRIVLAVVMALSAVTASAQDKNAVRARLDFLLHCSGCHGQDGTGNPEKGIPNFVGQVGHFQRLPEGREFVMQVPGLLSSGLPDDRAAAVTSWMIRQFAGPSLPRDFAPYSASEAKHARENRPADIMGKRKAIYQQLLKLGYVIQ
ncbi:MAG: c-type cytochrome [Burkholderiales bacterium]